jgi:hypothetical protein
LTLATWTAWEAGDARVDEVAGAVARVSDPEVCAPRAYEVFAEADMAAWGGVDGRVGG